MANPRNWSRRRRWCLTFLSASAMVSATVASSAPSGVAALTQAHYHTKPLAVTAIISVFVAGYIFGPLVCGPASEKLGRRPVLLLAFFLFSAFNLGCALAPNIEAMLVLRFLAGLAASAPITCVGAVIAEMWDPVDRGIPMGIFAISPFAGPIIGPIYAGFLGAAEPFESVYWVIFAFSSFEFIMLAVFLPETFEPVILQKKAVSLRALGQVDAWSPLERTAEKNWRDRARGSLGKPVMMLCTEPVVLLTSLYIAFVYGLLYLLFVEYSIVFEGIHHLNAGETGLMFLPLFIGGLFTVYVLSPLFDRRWRAQIDAGVVERLPEGRLPPTFVGGPLFAVSLFWFGWTAWTDRIHWAAPAAAGFFFGAGYIAIFQAFVTYLAEVYTTYAASALAANTILRSILAATFPLFARDLTGALGVQWASTLYGCLACLLIPVPWIFYRRVRVTKGLRASAYYFSSTAIDTVHTYVRARHTSRLSDAIARAQATSA